MTRPTACFPSLPPGYQDQTVWGFRNAEGRLSYEFHRVYGLEKPLRHRASMVAARLDEDRCYWLVSWLRSGEPDNPGTGARWISYADARKLRGSRLSFARFSSLEDMRGDLPELLARSVPPAETI